MRPEVWEEALGPTTRGPHCQPTLLPKNNLRDIARVAQGGDASNEESDVHGLVPLHHAGIVLGNETGLEGPVAQEGDDVHYLVAAWTPLVERVASGKVPQVIGG